MGKSFGGKPRSTPAITWRPIFASISRNGELGYTTGPWEYKKSRDAEKPDAFGHFVTIWQRDANGVWKVALDIGVNHPQPKEPETEIKTYVLQTLRFFIPNLRAPTWEKSSAAFQNRSRLMKPTRSSITPAKTFAFIAAASSRWSARPPPKKMLAEEDARTTRSPIGAGNSNPIDLAYEYGEYASARNNAMQRGIYLCIWRLDCDGAWKIALDLQKNAPSEKQSMQDNCESRWLFPNQEL